MSATSELKPGKGIGAEQFSLRALLIFFSLDAMCFSLIRASWLPEFLQGFFLFAGAMLMLVGLQWFALAAVARRMSATRKPVGEVARTEADEYEN